MNSKRPECAVAEFFLRFAFAERYNFSLQRYFTEECIPVHVFFPMIHAAVHVHKISFGDYLLAAVAATYA
jgi:hypothetical protein